MDIKEILNSFGVNTTGNFQLLHWVKRLKVKNFHILVIDELKDFNSSIPLFNR